MRMIGLSCIILAHCNANEFIHEIRSFDVVMLIFISGIFIKRISTKKNYIMMIKKRIKKLVIPTYILITSIWILTILISNLFNIDNIYSFEQFRDSYFFFEGIGYVWIVKIYLMIAFFTPLIVKKVEIMNYRKFTLIAIGTLIFNDLIVINGIFSSDSIIYIYILEVIPYCIVALIGKKVFLEKEKIKFYIGTFGFSFLVSGILKFVNNQSVLITDYKYPARFYYIVYGILCTLVIYYMIEKIIIKENKYIKYISENSFNIYLLHIIVLLGYNFLFAEHALFKWIFVYIVSIIMNLICEKTRGYLYEFFWKVKNKKSVYESAKEG